MDNYTKGKNVEELLDRSKLPFKDLPEGFLWMQVKGGSQMTNLVTHAGGLLEDNAVRVMVWSGAGVAIGKTISCSELVKRLYNIPYQVTKLTYKTDEEHWDPRLDGLETLVVKRHIPVLHVLLSIDEIDENQLGYQTLESKKFWQAGNTSSNTKLNQAHKSKHHHKNKRDHKR